MHTSWTICITASALAVCTRDLDYGTAQVQKMNRHICLRDVTNLPITLQLQPIRTSTYFRVENNTTKYITHLRHSAHAKSPLARFRFSSRLRIAWSSFPRSSSTIPVRAAIAHKNSRLQQVLTGFTRMHMKQSRKRGISCNSCLFAGMYSHSNKGAIGRLSK